MEQFGLFLARHPRGVAIFFGALVGFGGYQAFRAGVTYAQLRSLAAEMDRAASEQLGG